MKYLIVVLTLVAWMVSCTPTQETSSDAQAQINEEHDAEAAAEKAIAEGTSPFPADSVAPDGRSFHGFRIDEADAVPVAQLTSLLTEGDAPETMKLSGTVDAACQAKGCWMTMKLEDGSDMRVTFKDYGFFVPKDSPGKKAVIEGKASYDTTSVEMLRHYAVDGGMSEEEAEKKYTEPEVAIAFEATGVIIK